MVNTVVATDVDKDVTAAIWMFETANKASELGTTQYEGIYVTVTVDVAGYEYIPEEPKIEAISVTSSCLPSADNLLNKSSKIFVDVLAEFAVVDAEIVGVIVATEESAVIKEEDGKSDEDDADNKVEDDVDEVGDDVSDVNVI